MHLTGHDTRKDDEVIKKLTAKARDLRRHILAMAHYAGGAHIAPAFSLADMITVLFEEFLNFSPANAKDPNRDRFILSKGHSCTALYAVLADKGFFDKSELKKFCKIESILGGHPDMRTIPGVEASTGSLGHGFSLACGMAFAGKLNKKNYKVYTILGDGECQEGSVWETAMFASTHKLDNLVTIIDNNRLQGMGKTDEVCCMEPFKDKWSSFGWAVHEIDGHDFSQIINTLKEIPFKTGKPSVIIAHTIKGRGISFMENQAIWHFRLPNKDEMAIACRELEINSIDEVI